jgi:hypothetical protein
MVAQEVGGQGGHRTHYGRADRAVPVRRSGRTASRSHSRPGARRRIATDVETGTAAAPRSGGGGAR